MPPTVANPAETRDRLSDHEIRAALDTRLARTQGVHGDARVLHELPLSDSTRADVVAIGPRIEGFEIKSDRDSLRRLEHQVEAYEAVCDRVWLVTTERHFAAALARLPEWWGVLVAERRANQVVLTRARHARRHPQQDPYALAQLLWTGELRLLCRQLGDARGVQRANGVALRDRVAHQRTAKGMAADVRAAMLLRDDWRADRSSPESGAGSRPGATSSDCQGLRLPPHRLR